MMGIRHANRWSGRKLVILAGVGAGLAATGVAAKNLGDWSAPVSAEEGSHENLNTPFNDGCPILSPDGLSLYMASNRPGGFGNVLPSGAMDNQDIWVARRNSTSEGWGEPVNLGAPVNSAANDFCPTPARGKRLFFVTTRESANPLSLNGDIFVTREGRDGWEEPVRLSDNINSPFEEWSPSYYEDEQGRGVLYFSSTRPSPIGPSGNHNIYFSVDGGPAQLAPGGINTEASDFRPNVRKDGREIVFDRPGSVGMTDIFTASRPSSDAPWPAATELTALSSPGVESRASLSWDGSYLLFGSSRTGGEGAADIYVSRRSKVTGRPDAE